MTADTCIQRSLKRNEMSCLVEKKKVYHSYIDRCADRGATTQNELNVKNRFTSLIYKLHCISLFQMTHTSLARARY